MKRGIRLPDTRPLLLAVIILSACASTQSGIGPSRQSGLSGSKAGLEVLLISYSQAYEAASQVAFDTFTKAGSSQAAGTIVAFNSDGFMGDVELTIDPRLVKNLDAPDQYGIIFEVESRSYGGMNGATMPSYASGMFFKALGRYVGEKNMQKATFQNYEILKEKGVATEVADSIPTGLEEFISYLDQKDRLGSFEGVWTDPEGAYTLGVIADTSDVVYPYKAFVIESTRPSWSKGEVKIRFSRLSNGKLGVSRYRLANKSEIAVYWEVDEEMLLSIPNGELEERMAFVKSYPSAEEYDYELSSGTCWAVSEDGLFITNAHVVEGARRIYVGPRDAKHYRARAVVIDRANDIALIKVTDAKETFTPLPVRGRTPARNGSPVTVIGYPLASLLGQGARVTDGVISAQSGPKSDSRLYQISAAVQPGNSGAPILDPHGNVVGVVVSKFQAIEVENVSFAVKIGYVHALLQQKGIETSESGNTKPLGPAEIFETYSSSVFPVWTER